MFKKFLSLLLVFVMVLSMAPANLVAEGNAEPELITNYDISQGPVTITENSEDYVITGSSTTNAISVAAGVEATITLDNVTIKLSDGRIGGGDTDISKLGTAALSIGQGAKVTLKLVGTNSLTSGSGRAGIEVVGDKIYDGSQAAAASPATLTIEGPGSLTAQAGNAAAGIGGSFMMNGGHIVINSGTIVAKSTSGDGGAAIGGGHAGDGLGKVYGSFASVTVNGGHVTAESPFTGAGIGTGSHGIGTGAVITINGGYVKASGGSYDSPDDIGLAHTSNTKGSPTVNITGGVVAADDINVKSSDSSTTFSQTGGLWIGRNAVTMQGTTVTLGTSATIPSGKTLTLAADQTLIIPSEVVLTVSGSIEGAGTVKLEGGSVVNENRITANLQKFEYKLALTAEPASQTYNQGLILKAQLQKEADSSLVTDRDSAVTFTAPDGSSLGTANMTGGEATLNVTASWPAGVQTMKASMVVNTITISATVDITVVKADQTQAPAAPAEATGVTINSVTLAAVSATGMGDLQYGYAVKPAEGTAADPGKWQTGTTFTGLQPNTTYVFYTRFAGNEYYAPILSGSSLEVTTKALPELTAPVLSETPTTNNLRTVTLAAPAACADLDIATVQYSISADNGETWGDWQTSPTFNKLGDNKTYQFRARYAVTQYSHYSPVSNIVTITSVGIVLPEENYVIETGHTADDLPSRYSSVLSKINISGVKVLKHVYDSSQKQYVLLLDKDTSKENTKIDIIANTITNASGNPAENAMVGIVKRFSSTSMYNYRTGTNYADEGTTTTSTWVHSMTAAANDNRPTQNFVWQDDGTATIELGTHNGSDRYANYYPLVFRIAGEENAAPTLRTGVEATVEYHMALGETYSLRLGETFQDPDLDDMTYTVSVNGADAIEANGIYYSLSPRTAGKTTLVFTATDSEEHVGATYTVDLYTYELTQIPTGATTASNTNLNIKNIYLDSDKVVNVVDGETGTLAYVLVDAAGDDAILLRLDTMAAANRVTDVYINNTKVTGTIDKTQENPVWTGVYTPTWDANGEASLTFNVSYNNSNSGTNRHTIKLKLQSGSNAASTVVEGAAKTAEGTQYTTYAVKPQQYFTDSDDTLLQYFVKVNDGEEKRVASNWSYTPMTAGDHTLVMTAKDLEGKTAVHTLTLTAAAYTAGTAEYIIGNVAEDGALVSLTVKKSGAAIAGVTFEAKEEEGMHVINVTLPGETVPVNSTVQAQMKLLQNSDQVPFTTTYNQVHWSYQNKTTTFNTTLLGDEGEAVIYYYEAIATEESNVYETYVIRYQIHREGNTAPTLKEGVAAKGTKKIEQYETYTLDLSTIFADAENDPMTYTVFSSGSAIGTISGSTFTYTAQDAGEVTFIFRATDCFDAVSTGLYELDMTVNYVPNLTIETGDAVMININGVDTPCYTIKNLYVRGQEVVDHVYTKLDNGERIIGVQLDSAVADDAVVNLLWDLNRGNAAVTATPGAQVQLTDGWANVQIKSEGGYNNNSRTYLYTFYLSNEQNTLPTLRDGVEKSVKEEITIGETFKLDLAQIFTDKDPEILHYTVRMDGAEAKACDANYELTPAVTGTMELVFTALDAWGAGTQTYTVNLKALNSDVTYDVQVLVPADITPGFYANIGLDDTNRDILGDELEAVKGSEENGFVAYTVKVPENVTRLSVRGVDSSASNWGGLSFAVEADMDPVTMRQLQAAINTKISGRTPTTAEAIFEVKVDGDGSYATHGDTVVDQYGYLVYQFLLVAGDNAVTYTYYTRALGDEADNFGSNYGNNKTLTTVAATVVATALELAPKSSFSITAPTGALVEMFYQLGYYNVKTIPELSTTDNGDGTKTVVFNTSASSGTKSFRVSMEGKITKAGYCANNVNEITVDWAGDTRTPDHSEPYDPSTTYGSRGDDSMYVNVNYRNNLVLDVDETFRLKAYRIWEIINTDTTNIMIEPDFHYNILSGSDVISVTPAAECSGNAKGNWLDLKGLKAGTAVIEVTYDAIEIVSGDRIGDNMVAAMDSFTFNASDPARTALIVVQVGSDSTDINFGVQAPNLGTWDAEHDTVYFEGESTTITLKPTVQTGSIRKVEVSNDKCATWTELQGQDGVYTATILSGNNFIRITKADGAVSYQAVRGDSVMVSITEIAGYSDEDGIAEAGERLHIQLYGGHNPVGKMSGIYNPNDYRTNYTFHGSAVSGFGGQYSFPSNVKVEIDLPGDAAEGTVFSLTDGYVTNGGWGSSGGAHRDIEGEVPPGMESETISGAHNIMPVIDIEIGMDLSEKAVKVESVTMEATATVEAGKSVSLSANVQPVYAADRTVTWSSDNENIATVDASGKVTGVAAGTVNITAAAGEKSAICQVTVTAAAGDPGTMPGTPGGLVFDISGSEIVGYVTISFEDYGQRIAGETMDEQYQNPLGMIIPATRVPFKPYDSIATVTLRLLDALGYTYSYTGSPQSGFYLSKIGNFTLNNTYYEVFGEFDAGNTSGWMITWQDWFIDRGASEFMVEDGDYVRWQYTCQLGKDIGDPFYDQEGAAGNKPAAGTTEPTLTPEVKADENGNAEVEISADAIEKAIESNESDTLIVTPVVEGEATKLSVTLPKEAAEKLAENNMGLAVKSENASVTIAAQDLADISGAITVSVEGSYDGAVKVDVAAEGGKTVDAEVAVTIPTENASATTVLAIVSEDGTEMVVKKSLAGEEGVTALVPAGSTVKVVDNAKEYTDLDHWGKEALLFVAAREIFEGDGNKMMPEGKMTRAMMVTTLYRLENGVKDKDHNFTDVADGLWYSDAVAWAAQMGIVEGDGGKFDPDRAMTREEMVTMLYRYAQIVGLDTDKAGQLSGFADANDVSDWAKDAMAWAIGMGLIEGRDGLIAPDATAKRAEVATVYQRLIVMLVK